MLAVAYYKMGLLSEATKLFEQVVGIEEQVFTEDHPDLLKSQGWLADSNIRNGQIGEAATLREHIVKVQESLPEDHPDRLTDEHNLAVIHYKNGQMEEALHLFKHVVTVRRRVLAEDNLSRLRSEGWLARMYYRNGQVGEAIKLFQHVVKIRKRVLAEDHPDRLISEEWLQYLLEEWKETTGSKYQGCCDTGPSSSVREDLGANAVQQNENSNGVATKKRRMR